MSPKLILYSQRQCLLSLPQRNLSHLTSHSTNSPPHIAPAAHHAAPRQHRLLAWNHRAAAETAMALHCRGKQQGLWRNIEEQLSTADHTPAQEENSSMPPPQFLHTNRAQGKVSPCPACRSAYYLRPEDLPVMAARDGGIG
jgi:hypothetical protein